MLPIPHIYKNIKTQKLKKEEDSGGGILRNKAVYGIRAMLSTLGFMTQDSTSLTIHCT